MWKALEQQVRKHRTLNDILEDAKEASPIKVKRVKYHLQYIKDWEDFVKANEEFLDVDEITRQLMEVAPKDRKKKAKVIKSGKVWQRKKYGTKLQRLKEDYELQVQEFEKTVTRGSSKIQGDSELQ
ncbi:uncharacterized protein LOC112564878 isoform X5 [Pomacea canaliculata]|uniref:uncharacterized protein LOC112564878 isoform X5 n=1 Tax=Pomacea canaliculata TaxID=400727 RepID=UPI000D7314E1|nr:uncharacterized protein LOC112564878 isoform X5 [Pomacea canaliculata]